MTPPKPPDSSPDDPCAPRWHRRPESRPDEILEAAEAVFGEFGYNGTRLEEVARRAGVSKGTLYLYFESKEALFREMVRARVLPIVDLAEQTLQEHHGSPADLLVKVVRQMWAALRNARLARMSRLMTAELAGFPELGRFYYEEVVLRSRRVIEAVLERGIAAGEFRAMPHRFVARAVPALLVHQSQTQYFSAGLDPNPLSDEQVIDGVIDLVLHAVLKPSRAKDRTNA
ncbi:MAG TPA: TetR/AcrR family transcriptional regulator [Gemmatimonadales bacterium]|nr:TetR/AcrR family transcriptional regulator [Gemmatimonadales bacterium]